MVALHMLECVFNFECNVWLGEGGDCTKYTSVRQGHRAGGRFFDPQEPPRGKNVQVYDYLGKGQKAHYGGKKDEREAIFLSLVPTWPSG